MSVRKRHRCPFCGKDVPVTTMAVLYRHRGVTGQPCPGSSQAPQSVTLRLIGDDLAAATCMICGTLRVDRLEAVDGPTFFAEHSHPEQRTETTP